MERLIDILPGVSMPVEEVTTTLRHMWDADGASENKRSDFRASQMNLILHFGLETTNEEAQEEFETAVRFAQRYPCRIVVLCPSETVVGEDAFEGKLFSQCYIGKHLRDLCCCEALILGYSPEESDFLENQVSIWLEPDLPVYHWLHRVPAVRINEYYLGFLKNCRGVIYDGAIDGDAYDQMEWPNPDRIKDLAMARTLPLRQHLGQFLSGFRPQELVDELVSLKFEHSKAMGRAAQHLLQWHREAVRRCCKDQEAFEEIEFKMVSFSEEEAGDCLRISWQYRDSDTYLLWNYRSSQKSGMIRCQLPSGKFEHPLHIEPLAPESALAEAMFFV